MKLRKSILKIAILSMFIFIFTVGTVSAASIQLAIDEFRGQDSDGTYPAYGLIDQHIYKIYEINNGTKNYNRAIYCLDMARGFGSGSTGLQLNSTTEYNQSYNMLNTTDMANINTNETTNNSSYTTGDYNKIVKILKNIYIPGSTDKELFLSKMISNYDVNEYYITDRDIEIAQQLAIWHYTNENTKSGDLVVGNTLGDKNTGISTLYAAIYSNEEKTTMSDIIKKFPEEELMAELSKQEKLFEKSGKEYYNIGQVSDAYYIAHQLDLEFKEQDENYVEIIPETYKGMWNRFNGINQIYKSLLTIAESEESITEDTAKPLEMVSDNAKIEEDATATSYIAGPFKINKNSDDYYGFKATVVDESGNEITGYSLLDSTKTVTTKTIEDLVGEEFYIQLPITTTVKTIKFSFTAQYDSTTITYWTNGSNVGTTQPVAIVEKTPIDLSGEKQVTIPEKTPEFDVALRKFISAVGDVRYDRAPKVNYTKLYPNGTDKTAKYVHSKTPLSVKIGDIVTYTIRVYNEGQVDGYVGKVTDYLPEELTFISEIDSTNEEIKEATEFNAEYGWTIDLTTGEISTEILSKNTAESALQQEIIDNAKDRRGEDSTALLKAFDGTTLDYIDLQVKCKINDKATSREKITNIAEITEYEDKDGNTLTEDRDSQPANFPDDKKNNNYEGNGDDNGYIKGQQDDDDFERVIIQQFDLALRKFISDVDGKETSLREPVVDVKKLKDETSTTAEYNHIKQPITVVKGSLVTYTIRVYNEGDIDGYVNEITDYLPPELEYVEDSEINEQYGWKLSKDGRTVTTDYLKYKYGETDNLLKAFDTTGNTLDYKEVKIQCKVKDTAPYQTNITNLAQITEDSDSYGKEVEDRDSVPNDNFELPKDEELPKYKDEELSKAYIPGQEDDDDFEKINVVYFDLALRKIVSKAIVIEDDGETVTETNHKFEDDPEAIVKVDLGRKKINKLTVKFEYQIRITNEGLIEGYAKEVKDYIPEGLEFNAQDNPLWKEVSEGVITTDQLKDTLLKPGESKVVTVLLTWKNSEDNLGLKVNIAEISKDYNEFNTPDIDSTPDNKKDGEDDIDDAPVMLSIALGNAKTYIGLTTIMLVTTAAGIFLIKKFVL